MAADREHRAAPEEDATIEAPPESAPAQARPDTALTDEARSDTPLPGAGEEPAPEDVPEPEQARAKADEVQQDIEALQSVSRERDEYLSLAQRTQADFENYRRRMSREVSAAEGRGVSKLARELLPALDTLALALKAGEDVGGGDLAKGVRLVQADVTAALARLGIEPYSPEGERFDPELHEAMASQPVDGAEPGTVVEVYQPGYRIDGTVLRPARVVVAQ